MNEVRIQVGPKANNNFVVVVDHNLPTEKWFAEYDGIPREPIRFVEAEDILARKNRAACQKYFPMHGFSS